MTPLVSTILSVKKLTKNHFNSTLGIKLRKDFIWNLKNTRVIWNLLRRLFDWKIGNPLYWFLSKAFLKDNVYNLQCLHQSWAYVKPYVHHWVSFFCSWNPHHVKSLSCALHSGFQQEMQHLTILKSLHCKPDLLLTPYIVGLMRVLDPKRIFRSWMQENNFH